MKSAGRAEALSANINCIYLACQCQAGKGANELSGIFVSISLGMYSIQNSGRYTTGNGARQVTLSGFTITGARLWHVPDVASPDLWSWVEGSNALHVEQSMFLITIGVDITTWVILHLAISWIPLGTLVIHIVITIRCLPYGRHAPLGVIAVVSSTISGATTWIVLCMHHIRRCNNTQHTKQ